MNSWAKKRLSWQWRISSSAPRTAILRHAPARPKRAMRASAMTPRYSTSDTPPKWTFAQVFHPSSKLLKMVERSLDCKGRSFLLTLHGHVLGIADLVGFFPRAPRFARHFASSRLPLGKYGIVIGVGQCPVDLAYQVLPLFALHQSHGV